MYGNSCRTLCICRLHLRPKQSIRHLKVCEICPALTSLVADAFANIGTSRSESGLSCCSLFAGYSCESFWTLVHRMMVKQNLYYWLKQETGHHIPWSSAFKTPRSEQWWHSPHKNNIRFGSLLKWLEASKGWYDSKAYLFHVSMLVSPFSDNIQRRGFDKPLEKHHHSDLKKESGLQTFDDQNNKKTMPFKHHKQKIKRSREGYKPNATPTAKGHPPLSTKATKFNQTCCHTVHTFLVPSTNMSPFLSHPDDLPWCCSWCPQGGTVRRWIWSWSLGRSLLPN